MGKYTLDLKKYAAVSRAAAAEGCVLLKNEHETLPLRKGDKVAVFGRIAFNYYKSGLGSGGLVNTRYVVSILDALKAEDTITLDRKLSETYEGWIGQNPFDEGAGWGQVPWSQKEMELSDAVVAAAGEADIALVIIGRTAGEDQDNKNEAGSYLLTDIEKEMIAKVSSNFSRTAVILNVGNIIDMKWVETCNPSAVLYAWQGGQEGGNAVVDILTGRVNPCGKLTDTIARDITDYPSTAHFGDPVRNYYTEDIYVGYRYFETFAKDKVLYPFGFGLSYSRYQIEAKLAQVTDTGITVTATVVNTGKTAGKEVVQVYVKAPMGRLGKPARVLAGFAKTSLLSEGQTQKLIITIPKSTYASYDDSGATGHRSCFVLEEGCYEVFVGSDVRAAVCVGTYEEKNMQIVEKLEEACAPTAAFTRLKPSEGLDGVLSPGEEPVPLRTVDPAERIKSDRERTIPWTGDKGYKLKDVWSRQIAMDAFAAQLDDDDLIHLFHGEGMCSPKVTPGTAAAFGGLTDKLRGFGIPAGCCSDGPSGIRMDCGTKAFSMPNGTALGCTFNLELVESLYHMVGLELRKNKIDTLLGPGMNIHRNPLNGRNFEYISEDPLLTGKIAAAQLIGMEQSVATGTIKHYCGNNQETRRQEVDAIVSERALREIYLRGFEIAVKEGHCRSVMTTYGPVNGIWTAGSYDLNTTILRKEWGFDGIVMTDWWANANDEGEQADKRNRAPMIAAQNDLFMVTADATDLKQDNVREKLDAGEITRAELLRNAKNILSFLLKSPAMLRELDQIDTEELKEMDDSSDSDFSAEELDYYEINDETDEIVIDGSNISARQGSAKVFGLTIHKFGTYELAITMKSDLSKLAQLPISVYYDNIIKASISIQGTNGAFITESRDLELIFGRNHYLKLYFGANGLCIDKIVMRLKEEVQTPF